ncbi:MAG: ATP-binding protein [Anaerolineae bacterium]|nr:ATP-binding protein [Anaerolineae bacterium]
MGTIVDITERKNTELSLQNRLKELETVNRLVTSVNINEGLQVMLQTFLDETLKTMMTEVGSVLLLNPESNKLEWVVTKGWFEKMKTTPISLDEGISGYVFTHAEPRIVGELKTDSELSNLIRENVPSNWGAAILPIQSSEGTIGVLFVAVQRPRVISQNQFRLLTIISQLVGNAIARVRLDEQLRFTNRELQNEVKQRAAMQDLLAAERDLLNTTLMSLSEGVITTNESGLVTFINKSAEQITGYSSSDALNQPLQKTFRMLDVETNQAVENIIETLYNLEKNRNDDFRLRIPTLLTGNNEKRLIGGSIASITNLNKVTTGHVLVFQDITVKQQLEAQSMLSQKMEAIGQMAAGIAHEINTPIQYVGDNLGFLNRAFIKINDILNYYQSNIQAHLENCFTQSDLEEIESRLDEKKIKRYVNEIPTAILEATEGIERVRKIVLAIREFSHPSQKEKSATDLNHGIETTITISRNEWKYYADMETELDPDLPLVNCQIDEINQVILNMIINASQAIQDKIKNTPDQKGKIRIKTRKGENDKVVITIADTGSGIPKTILGRIFDPFFTTKGVGKGTGQGLSMAHNIIVNKHSGVIKVDSEVGEGTTFTIELPIDAEKASQ